MTKTEILSQYFINILLNNLSLGLYLQRKQISFIETDTDRYGRAIAKVFYDDKYLSAEIIRAGFGWWYFYFSKSKYLGELQEQAKANKLGLWQDDNAVSPWEYRKLQREKNQ